MNMTFEEFEIAPPRTLSPAQERRLHRVYCCGEAGGGAWSTVASLIQLGLLEERAGEKRLGVTELGAHYCFHHGRTMGV